MRLTQTLKFVATALAVTSLSACSGHMDETQHAPNEAEAIGTVEEAIVLGNAWAGTQDFREVQIRRDSTCAGLPCAGVCSGTLIRNDFVLTARHCVTIDGTLDTFIVPPANLTLIKQGSANLNIAVEEVWAGA